MKWSTIVRKATEQKGKEKVMAGLRAGCGAVCLLHCSLMVLASGRADRAGQPAPGVSGLAVLEAESLAAHVGYFYFPGELSGGLETLWMMPTRPVWLTAPRWEEESFWFSLAMSKWQRCTEVRV